ncbi:ATP-binding protein [Clostridium sp.]|uniref:ATP-binding protein n=1 Tax=Clostridium sp. TaxID=1506 RepID=UPI003F2B53CD
MNNFLNRLKESILIIDNDGKIELCNKVFLEKIKYSYEEILKYNLSDILYFKNSFNINENIDRDVFITFLDKNRNKLRFNGSITIDKWNNKDMVFISGFFIDGETSNKEDLEILLDKIPHETCTKSIRGKYLYKNKAYEKRLNSSNNKIIGSTGDDFVKAEACEDFFKKDNTFLKNKSRHIFNKIYIECGNELCFQTYEAPVYYKDINAKYTIGVTSDVPLEKKVNFNILKNYKILERINKIISPKETTEFYELISALKRDIMKSLGADEVSILTYDEREEKLAPILRIFEDSEDKSKNKFDSISVNKDDLYKIVIEKRLEEIANIENRSDLINKRKMKERGIKYVSTYGLCLNDDVLGVINVFYKELNNYSNRSENFINDVCNQLAILIKNKKLSEKLEYEFEKRTELESEMKNYLDISVDLMATFDKRGRFLKVNKGWTESLGWSEEELLSAKWKDFIVEEDLKKAIEYRDFMLKRKELKRIINRCKHKSGDTKWLEWSVRYLEDKEIYLTTARDITEERRIKKDTKLYKEALELESIKNEFFANISHEFKTPLNIILSTMQLINSNISIGNLKGFNGFDINKYMSYIKQNSYRLLRLVNNLIDMTKIETGYYEPEFENHNIVEIVEEITISVADYIEGKNIQLVFDTNEEEKIIACDPDKLERVMLNLLSNAVKYAKKDGKIEVNLNVEKEWITVIVQNDGLPIPREMLGVIFERFTQVDNEITKISKGSGIGLSLCKSLIEMHGGTIWAESGEEEMTKFIFTLPAKVINEEEVGKFKIPTNSFHQDNVEKCSIEFSDIYE